MKSLIVTFLISLLSYSTIAQNTIFDASRQGDINSIKQLYAKNNNIINAVDDKGYSPIVLASYYGHKDVVAFIVDKVDNLNIETSYGSPLMAATVKGYTDIVDILLKHNVNPNATDPEGTTAAHYAILFKKYDIVEKLVAFKADFTIKNNLGKSALDYAKSINDPTLNTLLNL